MSKKFFSESILLFALGVLTSLSLPPFNFVIINFFTFSFLFIFLIKQLNHNKDKKFFFLYGFLFGFGYFLSSLYWISLSLNFDPNFKSLIPLAIFLIPLFLGLFYGLVSYFFCILRFKNIISSFLFFSLIFGILEYLRGSILSGFPWNLIAYSFSNSSEILSINSIIGTYSFNLLCISLFSSPAFFFLKSVKKNMWITIFLFIIFFSFYFYGHYYQKKFNSAEIKTYNYKIRVIGSNISLKRFYDDLDPSLILKDLIEISDTIIDKKIIFIWPEGVVPGVYQDELSKYKELFSDKFNKNHLFLIGINKRIKENGKTKYFNSLSLYDHELNLKDSYDKINLVPFGEFLPFEKILTKFGLSTLTNNYQSFSRGKNRNIIKINEKDFSLRLLPLICYEIIYSGELFDNLDFDLIVNISEDGWFGKSIGPKQHFAHSIYRAIESGKYIVRSSNNGFASIINPVGQIEKSIDFGQSGFIDFEKRREIQPTIFSKYGNKVFGLLILLYILLIFSFNRFKYE